MELLAQLLLPVLVSGVAVFFMHFLSWGVLQLHKPDFKTIPNEMGFVDFVRAQGLAHGHYFFPNMTSKEKCNDPAIKEILKNGPMGTIAIFDPKRPMPLNMVLSFLINLATCVCVAYLASITIAKGAEFLHVFRVCGTAASMAFIFGSLPNQVWFQSHASTKLLTVIEGLACGLAVGAVFAWLWPR